MKQETADLRERLEAVGHDDIVVRDSGLRPTAVAAFENIKLSQNEEEMESLLAALPRIEDAQLVNDASTRLDGVHIGSSFTHRPVEAQHAILIHEAAHWHQLDDWYLLHHEDWDLASKCGYGHLNGQTKPGEIIVEAYATLWSGPAFLLAQAPELIPIVIEGAQAVGLPLPNINLGRLEADGLKDAKEASLEEQLPSEVVELT